MMAPALAQTVLPTVHPGDGPNGRIIAFVLQSKPQARNVSTIRSIIDKMVPEGYPPTSDFAPGDDETLKAERAKIVERARGTFPLVPDSEPLLFRVFDVPILIVATTNPLPASEFAQYWQPRRQLPDAAAVFSSHVAHTVVFALGQPKTTSDQVRAAEAVSMVLASYGVDDRSVVGTHWSISEMASTPAIFLAAVQESLEEAKAARAAGNPVKPLWHRLMTQWIDIKPVNSAAFRSAYAPDASFMPENLGDAAVGFRTAGLYPFIGRELELIPSAHPAHEQALVLINVLAYLLERGQVFNDNDTLGFTEDRSIAATLVAKGAFEGEQSKPVLRLRYIADLPEPAPAALEPEAQAPEVEGQDAAGAEPDADSGEAAVAPAASVDPNQKLVPSN